MTEHKNKKELQEKKKSFKKIKQTILWAVILSIIGYGIFWIITLPKIPQSELISNTGIHWHSNISITIKGEKVDIPTNIGIGAVHNPMHTHESDGTIHMEYGGLVHEKDVLLGNFFKTWGKDFSSEGIMGSINGEDGVLRMTVNSIENSEFENYSIKDGDRIEIVFE